MQFALFNLMTFDAYSGSPREVLDLTTTKVRMAEQMGFQVAWFAEHHFSSASVCPSPLMMMTHCAAQTQRIQLGSAVLVLPFYNPLRLVQELGMFHELSGGRLMIGIGTGHQPHEFRSFGLDIADRTERLIECWDVIEQGLTTGHVALDGQHFRFNDSPILLVPGRMPPVFLAGGSEPLLRRALLRGATPFVNQGFAPASSVLPSVAKIQAVSASQGTMASDIRVASHRYVYVTEDKAEAREAAEGLLRFVRSVRGLRMDEPPRRGAVLVNPPFEGEPTVESLLATAPIGSAEHVTEMLIDDIQKLPLSHMSFYTGFSGRPRANVLRALERLGQDVLPKLRSSAESKASVAA